MSAITDFARGKQCTARLPNICNHDPSTSVWAHIRSVRWGGGCAQKPPDVCGLIACSNCHDVIDRRVKTSLERDFVDLLALEGHMESIYLLHKEGII